MLTRIQIACMTEKTYKDYCGEVRQRPDYSIHAVTDKNNRSKTCTTPARTREGKFFAGGKHLRSARTRLSSRLAAHDNMKNTSGHTRPGSMNY